MSHKSAFDHLSENSSNIFLAQYARLLSKNPAVAQTIRRLPFAGIDQAIGPMRHTYRLPSVARKIFASVPLKILREYLASYLLHNMAKFDERFTASGIPEVFSELFLEHYRRIAGEIEAAQGPDDPASDRFAKELALARLRLIPAVAQLILPDSGIGLRTLAKIGLAHSLRLMSLTKGRRPFFEIHTHDATAGGNFNPEGWDRTYALAAELLRSQPDCRGLMGSSWFMIRR